MKLLGIILITFLGVVVEANDIQQIQPVVQRNSDDSVASVSYHLNDTFWHLVLTPVNLTERITIYPVSNDSISMEIVSGCRCHYRGVDPGNLSSRVALSICNGDQIHGKVFDGKDLYGLTYYEDEQYIQRFPQNLEGPSLGNSFYGGRKNVKETALVHIMMGFVVNSTLFEVLEQSVDNVLNFGYSIINIINALMEEFNIVIDFETLVIWTNYDYIEMTWNSNEMLFRFEKYITNEMPGRKSVDFVTLYTMNLSTEGVSRVGSMGSRISSAAVVNTDPHDVVINAHTTIHELFHLLGVSHDLDSDDFLMAASTSYHANIMVSKQSVVELNKNMPKIVSRLLQKYQQWTPIESCTGAQCEEPTDEGLPWLLIYAIASGVLVAAFYGVYRKYRRLHLEMTYRIANNPEAAGMPKELIVEIFVNKCTPDEFSTSLDSKHTDIQFTGLETTTPGNPAILVG